MTFALMMWLVLLQCDEITNKKELRGQSWEVGRRREEKCSHTWNTVGLVKYSSNISPFLQTGLYLTQKQLWIFSVPAYHLLPRPATYIACTALRPTTVSSTMSIRKSQEKCRGHAYVHSSLFSNQGHVTEKTTQYSETLGRNGWRTKYVILTLGWHIVSICFCHTHVFIVNLLLFLSSSQGVQLLKHKNQYSDTMNTATAHASEFDASSAIQFYSIIWKLGFNLLALDRWQTMTSQDGSHSFKTVILKCLTPLSSQPHLNTWIYQTRTEEIKSPSAQGLVVIFQYRSTNILHRNRRHNSTEITAIF